jgi:hypothetical protein
MYEDFKQQCEIMSQVDPVLFDRKFYSVSSISLLAQEDLAGLRFMVEIRTNACEDRNDVDDDIIENELALDVNSIVESRDTEMESVFGTIDWMLHPTYRVPTPYVTMANKSGQPISMKNTECLLRSLYETTTTKLPWIFEEHPYYCTPCFSLSICEIPERMRLCNECNEHEQNKNMMYFLQVLAMIGPVVGLRVSSRAFKIIEEMLC